MFIIWPSSCSCFNDQTCAGIANSFEFIKTRDTKIFNVSEKEAPQSLKCCKKKQKKKKKKKWIPEYWIAFKYFGNVQGADLTVNNVETSPILIHRKLGINSDDWYRLGGESSWEAVRGRSFNPTDGSVTIELVSLCIRNGGPAVFNFQWKSRIHRSKLRAALG